MEGHNVHVGGIWGGLSKHFDVHLDGALLSVYLKNLTAPAPRNRHCWISSLLDRRLRSVDPILDGSSLRSMINPTTGRRIYNRVQILRKRGDVNNQIVDTRLVPLPDEVMATRSCGQRVPHEIHGSHSAYGSYSVPGRWQTGGMWPQTCHIG